MGIITPEALMARAILVPDHWVYNWGTIEFGNKTPWRLLPRPLVAHLTNTSQSWNHWGWSTHKDEHPIRGDWGTYNACLWSLRQAYPDGIPEVFHRTEP